MASEWEDLAGVVDGANDLFTTSKGYLTGTITVWQSGLTEGSFTEEPPFGLRFITPPRVGDDLQAHYRVGGQQVAKDIYEIPSGVVDGANTTFFTSVPYVPTTLKHLLEGQVRPTANVVEVNPVTGEFTVTPAPRAGTVPDKHEVRFTDTSVDVTVPVIPITVIPVPVIPITVLPNDPPVIPITVT